MSLFNHNMLKGPTVPLVEKLLDFSQVDLCPCYYHSCQCIFISSVLHKCISQNLVLSTRKKIYVFHAKHVKFRIFFLILAFIEQATCSRYSWGHLMHRMTAWSAATNSWSWSQSKICSHQSKGEFGILVIGGPNTHLGMCSVLNWIICYTTQYINKQRTRAIV